MKKYLSWLLVSSTNLPCDKQCWTVLTGHCAQLNTVDINDSNVRSHSDECSTEIIETEEEMPQNDNTVCENAVDEKVQCFTAKFESLHQAFGISEVSTDKLLRLIGTIKNAPQWDSFI
jgi:hypothetical protein